jgi:hypothetical protein
MAQGDSMKTSYFFSNKLTKDDILVSIAGLSPDDFKKKFPDYRIYKPLIPPKQLVLDYKSNKISIQEYTRVYKEQLNNLDPFKVYDELSNAILLCWEKPEKFCHRHLVSDWIYYNTGHRVYEIKD